MMRDHNQIKLKNFILLGLYSCFRRNDKGGKRCIPSRGEPRENGTRMPAFAGMTTLFRRSMRTGDAKKEKDQDWR